MPDTTEDLRRLLSTRIAEIDAEMATLRAGLRTLGEAAPRPDAAKKTKSRRRTVARSGKSRKRAARGQRRAQVIEAIRNSPDGSVADLARTIGIAPSQAHKIVSKFREEGIF
jgi:hypothetical protein